MYYPNPKKNVISPQFIPWIILLALSCAFALLWQNWQQEIASLQAANQAKADAVARQRLDDNDSSRGPLEAAIQQVLETQQSAWNAGDIDQFMESYWKSEDLTFSSGGKVTRGWQATLDNYKIRYSTRDEMGQLAFSDLEITPLGQEAALVLGEWQLTREPKEDLGGKFSLVFRRLDGKWLIVHDHTSRAEQP